VVIEILAAFWFYFFYTEDAEIEITYYLTFLLFYFYFLLVYIINFVSLLKMPALIPFTISKFFLLIYCLTSLVPP